MAEPTNKKASEKRKNTVFSRRGMRLESMIDDANEYYLTHDIANIHKKPTPITIVDVDYKSRSTARITDAYFVKPSTTDYNGVYKGFYLDFDAKQTTNANNFPLSNVKQHQIDHLTSVLKNGGIGFMIIEFSKYDEDFILPASNLLDFWRESLKEDGAKSIKYQWFVDNTSQINSKILPIFDYLSAVGSLLENGR
ncbi:MAG: Holliday junction resolvase RecU [Lactobacillaceae bacterium]|nr:Holliday junction resolvase RecU [Lactobacillaceae bacterium]